MKVVNLFFQIIIASILIFVFIFFFTGYESAFEADQLCHSNLSSFETSEGNYGCDHDTETHQWILFENQNNGYPAKIIKRFRYRFL